MGKCLGVLEHKLCLQPSAMTHETLTNTSLQIKMLNKHIEVGKLQIQTLSLRVNNMPRSVYLWARFSTRCMPAVLCMLHHYISAWRAVRSACDLLFYITALPFSSQLSSGSVPTPPPLHFSALHALHISSSALWISLPTLPFEQFLLTHKHCQVELAGLYITQTDCLLTSRSFKNTTAPLSYTFAWN